MATNPDAATTGQGGVESTNTNADLREKSTDEIEFETWLESKEIGLLEYKAKLGQFTIAMFGSYSSQDKFETELLNHLNLTNPLTDRSKFYLAYQKAHAKLNQSGT